MSPLYVNGVRELAIVVPPLVRTKQNLQAQPLELTPRVGAGQNAVIQVDNGSLELHGVRIVCANDPFTAITPYLVQVRGGDLRLTRSWLVGPLSRAPQSFQALIAFTGAGPDATRPARLSVQDSLLRSGKALMHLAEGGARVAARNNIGMALGPTAILIDAPAHLGRAGGIVCTFEYNTWAVRHGFLGLRSGAETPSGGEAVVMQALANYFVDPFGDVPGQAVVLRPQEPALEKGLLQWQGRANAFDQRLQGFCAPLGATNVDRQTLNKDWLAVWGPAGEQDALSVGPGGPTRAVAINPDLPLTVIGARLALPGPFDPKQPPAGANLNRLSDLWLN
jgi:hypothetical protein